MIKIYVVTDGRYSDYQIERIFSKKEIAEEYIHKECLEGNIEEHYIDEDITQLVEYTVEVGDNLDNPVFKVHSSYKTLNWKNHGEYFSSHPHWGGNEVYFFVVVLPVDKASNELAAKIVSDWVMQIRASHLKYDDWGIITRRSD